MKKPLHRTLPLFVLVLLVLAIVRGTAAGQSELPPTTLFFPMISRNLAGWIGPFGGTITALAGDPSNTQVFYAGSWGSGVFKTADGGQTWAPMNQGLESSFIQSIGVDPLRPNIVFASTYKHKLYKSVDGGATWQEANSGIQPEAVIYSIAFDPKNTDIIFIGTRGISTSGIHPYSGKLYRSTDGGQSWVVVLENVGVGPDGKPYQDWAYDVAVSPNNSSLVVAALHQNGTWLSNSGGAPGSWVPIGPWGTPYGRSIAIFKGAPNESRTIYGGWTTNANLGGTYLAGELGAGYTAWGFNNLFRGFDVYRVFMNPFDPKEVHIVTFFKGIWTSFELGNNWQESGLGYMPLYTLAARSPYSLLAGTYGGGVMSSEDVGSNWNGINQGLTGAPITGVIGSQIDEQKLYVGTIGGGVYQTLDGGVTWTQYNRDLSEVYLHSIVRRPGSTLLFALTDANGLYISDLAAPGGYWNPSNAGLPQKAADTLMTGFEPERPLAGPVSPDEPTLDQRDRADRMPGAAAANGYKPLLALAFAPSDGMIGYLGTAGDGLYKTTTGGTQWAAAGLEARSVTSVAVHPLDPNLLYAATDLPGVVKTSTTGGTSWTDLPLPTATLVVHTLVIDPSNPTILYAGTDAGLYRWTNSSWAPVGLAEETVMAIGLHPSQPGTILIGTTAGAYRSLDGGVTWEQGPGLLAGLQVQTISFDQVEVGPVWVFYGTEDHGVLRDRFD